MNGLHNSILLLDKDALLHNAAVIQEEIGPAKLVPVLKCNAYGLGAVAAAKTLETAGVEAIAVAQVHEGLELREAGVTAAIWVLSIPLDWQVEAAARAGLTLPLGSLRQVLVLCAAAEKLGAPLPIQLKLDTGLHRIGFLPEELEAVAAALKENRARLRVTGTFSQFADGARAQQERQFARFLEMLRRLEELGVQPGVRHISCSASSELSRDFDLDAVRIGRRLFMDSPTAPDGRIKDVASFRAYLTDVRPRKAGDSLSYGDSFFLARDAVVGVLSVGYGDGLDLEFFRRKLPVLIRGHRVSLLACCMDQSFVDLTGIDCCPGDEVTFFGYDREGDLLPVQEQAARIGANEGCALTSALGGRVARLTVEGAVGKP